jgi:hypothetical protein
MPRHITTHHDGHGLNDAITIIADDRDPVNGSTSHHYTVCGPDGAIFAEIRFQQGPRNVEGSTPGITDAVLAAIWADRLEGYQSGRFHCAENEEQLRFVNAAHAAARARVDRRAKAGTLGTLQTDK